MFGGDRKDWQEEYTMGGLIELHPSYFPQMEGLKKFYISFKREYQNNMFTYINITINDNDLVFVFKGYCGNEWGCRVNSRLIGIVQDSNNTDAFGLPVLTPVEVPYEAYAPEENEFISFIDTNDVFKKACLSGNISKLSTHPSVLRVLPYYTYDQFPKMSIFVGANDCVSGFLNNLDKYQQTIFAHTTSPNGLLSVSFGNYATELIVLNKIEINPVDNIMAILRKLQTSLPDYIIPTSIDMTNLISSIDDFSIGKPGVEIDLPLVIV